MPMPRSQRRTVQGSLITAAALLLAACSSSTAGSGTVLSSPVSEPAPPAAPTTEPAPATRTTAAALPDACKLITRQEAEQLVPVHMQPGDDTPARDPANDIASCTYAAVFTGPSGHLDVFVQMGIPHALQVDRAIHHRFRTVPGIADQALEEPDNESIFVRKGPIWVYVEASGIRPAGLVRAAQLIATRLP